MPGRWRFSFRVTSLGLTIAQILVILFIHNTFYQGEKSPVKFFLALSIITGTIDVVWASVKSGVGPSFVSFAVTSNWLWHASIAYKAFHQIAQEKYVEDWVKTRYKLMIAYCISLAMTGISFLYPVNHILT